MSNEHEAVEPGSSAERLDALHRMAGALTHDFNNLLAVILSASETLAAELEEGAHRSLALVGLHAAERGAELLQRLMDLAQDRPAGAEDIDCAEVLETVRPLARIAIPAGVAFRIETPKTPVHCAADPAGLEGALLNLCLNAGQATPVGGAVTLGSCAAQLDFLDARRLGLAAGGYAVFKICDTGIGMSPEILARATQPLFTTKARGTGLGLCSVADFAAAAKGALALSSRPGRGTTATLYIPMASTAADEPERAAA